MQKYKNLSYKKLLLAVFTISLFMVGTAYARVDVLMQTNGYKLHFDVDNNRNIEILGLPFAGTYIYSARQGLLYVKHPEEEQTYFISLANLYKQIPVAKVSKVGIAPKQFGVETIEWRIKFPLRTCATVYASKPASNDTNLNVADIININALISYIYVVKGQEKCTFYRLSSASGSVIGLPLWSSSNSGESKITGIVHNNLSNHILPKNAVAFNQEAKIRFLVYSLNKKYKAIFEQTATTLPINAQEKIVKRLLIEQGEKENTIKSKQSTPPAFPNQE